MDHELTAPNPVLSVVVVIVSDTTEAWADAVHLDGCLDALARQVNPPPMEIIVPYRPPVVGLEMVKQRFPHVNFVQADQLKAWTGEAGSREHHDELRARGLAVACGEIIGLLEDVGRPDPHWCANAVAAHRGLYQESAAVGGAIENGVELVLNWAVYYCDFGKYQNPLPPGETPFASDANIAYKRTALESIQSVWQEAFRETAVNWALRSHGDKIALSPDMVVYQHRGNLRLGSALRERFIWGRSFAATRSQLLTDSRRLMYAAISPALPLMLLMRMTGNALRRRRHVRAFFQALPLTSLLTAAWAYGELVGYSTARIASSRTPIGKANARA